MQLYICFNAISYEIAKADIRLSTHLLSIVVYDPNRICTTELPRTIHLEYKKISFQIVWLLSKIRIIRRAMVPHSHIHARRLQKAVDLVRCRGIIDDGLDTLRTKPKNIKIQDFSFGSTYLTFKEHQILPDWITPHFSVKRIASLLNLSQSTEMLHGFAPDTHVIIESPGINIESLTQAADESNRYTLIIRHPAPEKRSALKSIKNHIKIIDNQTNLDAMVAKSRNVTFHMGETMSLPIAITLEANKHNRFYVHLSTKQIKNLSVFIENYCKASNVTLIQSD